jgi:hypothetical protein
MIRRVPLPGKGLAPALDAGPALRGLVLGAIHEVNECKDGGGTNSTQNDSKRDHVLLSFRAGFSQRFRCARSRTSKRILSHDGDETAGNQQRIGSVATQMQAP